ncbi:hypothetical protein HDE_02481 [Halotydeus destructor]|nr:hypothetical protein HDE_02481 [Halotydeus destructor]
MSKNMNVRPFPVASRPSLYPALPPYHTVVAVADSSPHTPPVTQTENKDRIVITSSNIHPPPFDGETGNVDDWIETLEMTAVANEWSDETKMNRVPAYLTGPARQFYLDYRHRHSKLEASELGNDNGWSHFKTSLRQTFGFFDTAISNFDAMQRRKQQLGENAMAYFLSKLSLIRKYNPNMDEREKVLLITQGLLATMFERIYSFQCKTVDDLRDKLLPLAEGTRLANTRSEMTTTALIAQAQQLEAEQDVDCFAMSPKYGGYDFKQGASQRGRTFARGNSNVARESNDRRLQAQTPERRRFNCHYCNIEGHYVRDCRKRMNDERNRGGFAGRNDRGRGYQGNNSGQPWREQRSTYRQQESPRQFDHSENRNNRPFQGNFQQAFNTSR